MREKVRGVYRFSSLMKPKKKEKNYAVFCFAAFFFLKFSCYEVIVKQKMNEPSRLYYLHALARASIILLQA